MKFQALMILMEYLEPSKFLRFIGKYNLGQGIIYNLKIRNLQMKQWLVYRKK
jgi:hypothetical protein